MTQERWQKIEQIYHAALRREGHERAAYLQAACAGDDLLYREVDSLLANAGSTDEFLEKPAIEAAAKMLADEQVRRYSPGQQLGEYTVVAPLGAGGMGVVYRARDARLGRDVAIKMLPLFLSADRDRLRRFEQEARAVAALNHPNILAVFQRGTHEGAPYLVSELLEGSTLRERLKRGPLPLRRTLDCGAQIARGLAAAHEKGIVHRDLKPENLFVTKDGRVKILDFGLAKLTQRSWTIDSKAPTASDLTEPNAVLGTVGYMSPEQVRGKAADHRADIFAFGAVLYEMLTGKRAFQKATPPETMSAILNEDPPAVTQLAPTVPPGLQRVIQRCLEKNPEQRFQSASDLAFALEALSESGTAPATTMAQPASRRSFVWAAGLTVVTLGLAVGGYAYFHRTPKLTDKDAIVVADFTNVTGDPVFDGALRQGLSVQLEQSPFLNLVSDDQIERTLRMMDLKPDAKLTPDVARQLCERTGSAAVLDGSIAEIGTQYLLTLNAERCSNGDTLASTEATASDKNHVLAALGKIAFGIRNKLGESLNTVQKFDTPLEQATTPSLEALQAYSFGRRAMSGSADWSAAVPYFHRAISLDPKFAIAYARLGMCDRNLGQATLGAQNVQKAYELRERASELEKFYIEAHYYLVVVADLEKARQVCELWAQTYPRDFTPRADLTDIYTSLGQYDKAHVEAREALHLGANGVDYAEVASSEVSLNRLQEARFTAQEMQAKNFDFPELHFLLYDLAFLQNDAAGMAQQVAWAAGKPGTEDVLLELEADTEGYFGQLNKSRDLSRRAVESAAQAEETDVAAVYDARAALREALFGNATEARQRAAAALALSTDRDVEYEAALASALAGDAPRARTLVDNLAKRFPQDTVVSFNYLPALRAQLALSANEPSEALQVLEIAEPYELGSAAGSPIALYPVYTRAEAYLHAHQGSEAAAEFQKIIDHPGITLNEPIGALAHLGLGRAYALQGDTPKAKVAYQDFLALWAHADPDIPLLTQAKAEYAKLK